MKPPGIGIAIGRPIIVVDGDEIPATFQDIEISGNRAGLTRLAELILWVAESEQEAETHIYPDDDPRLLRTDSFSLTISKNSLT
jgi:hypothetical protein